VQPEVEAIAVDGEGIGHSRGGPGSKIHLAVDGRSLPMGVILTPGQDGDNPQLLLPLLEATRVRRTAGGRPRSRPEAVLADTAYSHPCTRAGIRFTSSERSDQIARRAARGGAGGRPPDVDRENTSGATSSNAASTSSSSCGIWHPATPNAPPTTRQGNKTGGLGANHCLRSG
jgi:hypothetical protein